jgi:hypothetical protein
MVSRKGAKPQRRKQEERNTWEMKIGEKKMNTSKGRKRRIGFGLHCR